MPVWSTLSMAERYKVTIEFFTEYLISERSHILVSIFNKLNLSEKDSFIIDNDGFFINCKRSKNVKIDINSFLEEKYASFIKIKEMPINTSGELIPQKYYDKDGGLFCNTYDIIDFFKNRINK